jgi:uncharacterized membrane protein YbhN (UPF0104 family)
MRLLICILTAVVYVWQEQLEFKFSQGHLTIFIVGLGILCLSLLVFLRGPSRIQPPESIAKVLRFIGRHTLEIYAIELIVFELIAEWLPDRRDLLTLDDDNRVKDCSMRQRDWTPASVDLEHAFSMFRFPRPRSVAALSVCPTQAAKSRSLYNRMGRPAVQRVVSRSRSRSASG